MLTGKEINEFLHEPRLEDRLIITPLLGESTQVGAGSVDLRLGFQFLLSRRANVGSLDPGRRQNAEIATARYYEPLTLSRKRRLHLHPGEFLLGATLEYVRLPTCLGAYVTSRSSWGRMGLVIATATAVSPGFAGVITLELANVGTTPIVLRPGVRIAQMVLHRSEKAEEYRGRYLCPTGPQAGRPHLDTDLDFWIEHSGEIDH